MGTTPPSYDLKGVRALVVEDTWHVGKALQKLLEDLGAEVAGPAATVPEAERLIAESPPTVAFIDRLQARHVRRQRQCNRGKAATSDRHILGPVAASSLKGD